MWLHWQSSLCLKDSCDQRKVRLTTAIVAGTLIEILRGSCATMDGGDVDKTALLDTSDLLDLELEGTGLCKRSEKRNEEDGVEMHGCFAIDSKRLD